MAARVAGCRDGDEIRAHRDRLEPLEYSLGARLGRKLQLVNDPLGAKTRGVFVSVGDIIAVRQENVADAAALGEAARQVLDKPRRIDQPVATGMLDEVAVPTERLPRVEAAVRDA